MGGTHEQGAGSGSCSWNNSSKRCSVSRSSTELNRRSSLHGASCGRDGEMILSLNRIRYAPAPQNAEPSVHSALASTLWSTEQERGRAPRKAPCATGRTEQEKGVFLGN